MEFSNLVLPNLWVGSHHYTQPCHIIPKLQYHENDQDPCTDDEPSVDKFQCAVHLFPSSQMYRDLRETQKVCREKS